MIQDLESFSVALQGEKDKRKEQKKERREEMEDLLKQLDASREMIERHFAVVSGKSRGDFVDDRCRYHAWVRMRSKGLKR